MTLPDSTFDPQRRLEQKEVQRRVQEGLQKLSPDHRQVLILRELSGLSYDEIAASLDVDVGTVKSRIARARNSLRKILQE